jgi:outer membrane protein OmpA-like peptidoglycan-associated protein
VASEYLDDSWFSGNFMVLESTKSGSSLTAKGLDDLIPSTFHISENGKLTEVPKDKGFPTFRSFPTFPEEEIQPGDTWTGEAIRTVDPLNKGIYTKLQIVVQYTYIGKEVYKETPVYHIKAKWATRYGSGTLYHDWEGDKSLIKATGSHTADIMVSIETGAAILIRDTVDETFFYDNGNNVAYKGTILLFTEFPPSIDKTKITSALSKIASIKTESNSEDYYKDGVLSENPSISGGYGNSYWNDDYFQVNTSSGYLGNGGSETTFNPKPSTQTVVTKPATAEPAKNDMVVEETDAGLRLSVRNLQFYPDSSELLASEKTRLDEIAAVLKLAPESTFLVEGHSASTGNPTGEKNLSVERAKSIVDELVKRGIPAKQFIYRGLGSEVPIADNSTAEGKAQNRRVEITILE